MKEFQSYTSCASCGEMAYCQGATRVSVQCGRCLESGARLAPSDDVQRELEADLVSWIRAGMGREGFPSLAACNSRVLARLDAERETRKQRRLEARRQRNEAQKAERAGRTASAIEDFNSGCYTEGEVAEMYQLSVRYLRRLVAEAA